MSDASMIPSKKQRLSDDVIIEEEEESNKEDITLMHEYRNQLKNQLTKQQIELLLKYNRQKVPPGIENVRIKKYKIFLIVHILNQYTYHFVIISDTRSSE